MRGAHPRSRGENTRRYWYHSGKSGSSPLTRGKHQAVLVPLWKIRLIPAHAGKTTTAGPLWIQAWAHPRSRGENTVDGATGLALAGSSPLTRGKHLVASSPRPAGRLIPAHAGKTGHHAPHA